MTVESKALKLAYAVFYCNDCVHEIAKAVAADEKQKALTLCLQAAKRINATVMEVAEQ